MRNRPETFSHSSPAGRLVLNRAEGGVAHAQAGDRQVFGRAAGAEEGDRFVKAVGLDQALARVVADVGQQVPDGHAHLAGCDPALGVHVEVRRALGRVDRRIGTAGRPAQLGAGAKLVDDGLGQRDVAPERRVHRVVEKLVIEKAVRAEGVEECLAVDEHRAVPRGDLAVDVLEVGRAPHRQAVEVAGGDIVAVGVVPGPGLLQQPGQSEMRLGEPGLPGEQGAIQIDAPMGIGCLGGARGLELALERRALGRGRPGREHRAVRLISGVIGGRDHQDGKDFLALAVGGDRIQPGAEVGPPRGVFLRRADRDVDQPARDPRWRRAADAVHLGRFLHQAANRREPGREPLQPHQHLRPSHVGVVRNPVRPGEARRELVVPGVDDHHVRPVRHPRELLVHLRHVLSRAGLDLDADPLPRDRPPELPGDDLADRESILVRHSLRARFAHDDQ